MEISNNTFSAIIRKYENEAKIEEAEQTQELASETSQTVKDFAEQQYLQAQEASANSNGDFFVRSDGTATTISNINLVSVGDAEDVDSTEETNAVANGVTTVVQQASSYSDTDLDYIKELIYNSHHSFIANFRDADTFFDYVNAKKDSTITKETGISRAQLVSITQNDIWEDNHQDFFGSLNRSFYSLDKNGDGILKYDEIQEFMNTYLKKDGYNDFKAQVQAYSNEIQKEFDNASSNPKAKIQLIIDYTRDYLEAAGLTNHIKSLDRLLKEEDLLTDSNHHVGNISFRDLNADRDKDDPIRTSGGYTAWASPFDYTNENTNKKPSGTSSPFTQEVGMFLSETDFVKDGKTVDLGLSFDISLLKAGQSWEYLVSVLVHELTHATMAEFSTVHDSKYGVVTITEENLSALQRMGVFSSEEYETVKNHLKDINAQYGKYVKLGGGWYGGKDLTVKPIEGDEDHVNVLDGTKAAPSLSDDDVAFLDNLLYKIDAARGEYMAYQADADYLDSVAGDVLSAGVSETTVNGDKEQDTIIDWINKSGYNVDENGNPQYQPLPDWKWWSYA